MPLIGSLGAAASRGFGQFLQKITAVLNTDAFFKYVTLLLTGNPPTSTFVTDASTNNLQVTINGDTKPSGFSPNEGGYYSNYFDGSGDYLSTPTTTALNLATGDFTVEAWVYVTSSTNVDQTIIASNQSWGSGAVVLKAYHGGNVSFTAYDNSPGGSAMVSYPATLNTWTHVAFTRVGTTFTLYINGTNRSTATSTINVNFAPAGGTYIGYDGPINATTGYLSGYISNLRVIKGTAIYTANFTPSTTPLTAVSGTSLLTCQSNRFIDNSTNAFAITANGNTTVNSLQPFTPNPSFATYGSTYFDGSGDTLNLAASTALLGAGDYTVEFFVYLPSAPTGGAYFTCFAYGASGSVLRCFLLDQSGTKLGIWVGTVNKVSFATTAPINKWAHIAITRSGTTNTAYINGVNVATFTDSTNFNTGQLYIASQTATNYLTGYISNFRIVVGTALYTSAFTPPTTQLTAVTNTSLLTCQTNQPVNNNVFLDSSSNNFPITRAGNTTQGSLNPYGANWSNYFDGSGDYLSVASAFSFSGNFTVECWVYVTGSVSGYGNIWGNGNISGTIQVYIDNATKTVRANLAFGSDLIVGSAVSLNTWNHIAFTRSGSTLTLWLNGVSQGTSTTSVVTSWGANQFWVGNLMTGYISNFRSINGTALYTTAFTPPTTPLTAVSGTSLLTCQSNRLIDNSNNNFTITKTGDVSVQRFSPFSPILSTPTSYSNYFDGTGDYLNCSENSAQFGTSDFTIECWIYPTSLAVIQVIVDFRTTSTAIFGQIYLATNGTLHFYLPTDIATTNTVTLNAWNHIAISRSAGTLQMFINGTSGYSAANSGTYNAVGTYIGISINNTNGFTGYISNMRFITGTGIYTSNFTPSTTPLTAVSGTSLLTCQSPTFIDNSTNNFAITATGNVVPRTQNPFGVTNNTNAPYTPATYGGSMYFDGTTDYLTLATNPQLGMGSGDFTVEFWTYQTSLVSYRQILDVVDANSVGRLILWVDSAGTIYNLGQNGNSRNTSAAGAIVANTWVHVVLTRSSGTTKFYINGVQSGTNYTDSTNYTCTSGSVYIGINSDGGTYPYIGYLANFRMVKGTSLYKSNFAPPVAPLQAVTNTSLLLLGSNGAVYDSAMFNDAETLGDSKTSTAQSKFGGSSVAFDGTGDYLKILPSNRYQFQANYTIEFWVYFNSVTGTQDIIGNYVSNVATDWIVIMSATGIQYYPSGSSSYVYSGASSVTTNTWYHVAAVRSGSTCSLYLNGVSVGTPLTFSTTLGDTTKPLYIGSRGGSSNYFNGYMDDLRITNWYARYTQNFTVPTQPFPVQ